MEQEIFSLFIRSAVQQREIEQCFMKGYVGKERGKEMRRRESRRRHCLRYFDITWILLRKRRQSNAISWKWDFHLCIFYSINYIMILLIERSLTEVTFISTGNGILIYSMNYWLY